MKRDAEDILLNWGRWSRDNPGLLISSCGVIGRCIEQGAGASQPGARPGISMPKLVELAEEIVLSMSDDQREVMVLKFVKKLTVRDGCKQMHCNATDYFFQIQFGIMYTAGYLAAIEN